MIKSIDKINRMVYTIVRNKENNISTFLRKDYRL